MATRKQLLDEFGVHSIVNYLRKSRQDEDREKKTGEDTLHEQKQLMDRVLSEYGIPYDQRPEVGSGDKISSRPVFQQVIRDIETGKYDAIAVKEISRMGRGSYTDMGIIYDLITQRRVFIITPWKIYDPSNQADLRQIRFELFMSREEFETTRERLNGGRYNAAMEGKWVAGPAPFGYTYNPNTKHLEVNEEQAKIVRAIFDFYANGIILNNGKRKLVQFRALCTYLKRVGIKTVTGKDEWAVVQLQRFLENDRYIGTIRFNTHQTIGGKRVPRPENEHIVVEDAHPPIIDMDTWNKVQDRMNNRDTVTNTKLDFDPCELAGICVCKKCGRKMVRQYSTQHYKKKDGTTNVYHKEFLWCTTTGCTFVKYRSIEEDLLETLRYLKDLDKDTLEKQVELLSAAQQENSKTSEQDILKHIQSRRKELERRMDFIHEKFESGIYDDDMFLKRKKEIQKELDDLEKVDIQQKLNPEEPELNADIIKTKINSILEAYDKADYKTDRNKIMHAVFDHVVVEVLEKGRGRKPAVHSITPYLKSSFLMKERA